MIYKKNRQIVTEQQAFDEYSSQIERIAEVNTALIKEVEIVKSCMLNLNSNMLKLESKFKKIENKKVILNTKVDGLD